MKGTPWLLFLLALAYASGLWVSLHHFHYSNFVLFWLLGAILATICYKTVSVHMEMATLFLPWLVSRYLFPIGEGVLYLPLVASVLIFLSHPTGAPFSAFLVFIASCAWFFFEGGNLFRSPDPVQIFIVAVTFLSIWIHLREQVGKRRASAKIDLILCSDTGNTAHYANQFIKGAERGGTEVTVHRFHRRREFNPSLNGDALVVAFPVSGWKPPWPLLDWLSLSLPHGAGKPAFCMYTSAGGPENAGIPIWAHLTARGYRVCGRMWAAYPLNVPTFRIGPASLWKFLDRQVPIERDLKAAEEVGEAFARGGRAGLPFVFWPSLLWLFGYLADNRWINVFLYRNYVWKRRCNHCNRCIEHCPIERLRLADGFPRPVGTCALCLGCVNLCPKNAMHMACWTEYGNPYKPRWPGLVFKRKPKRRTDPDE